MSSVDDPVAVADMRRLRARGLSCATIGQVWDCDAATVLRLTKLRPALVPRYVEQPPEKPIDEAVIDTIRERRKAGQLYREIAQATGLNFGLVWYYARRIQLTTAQRNRLRRKDELGHAQIVKLRALRGLGRTYTELALEVPCTESQARYYSSRVESGATKTEMKAQPTRFANPSQSEIDEWRRLRAEPMTYAKIAKRYPVYCAGTIWLHTHDVPLTDEQRMLFHRVPDCEPWPHEIVILRERRQQGLSYAKTLRGIGCYPTLARQLCADITPDDAQETW